MKDLRDLKDLTIHDVKPTRSHPPTVSHGGGESLNADPSICTAAPRNAQFPPRVQQPRQSVRAGKFIQKRVRTRSPLLKTTALRGNGPLATPSKTLAWKEQQ